MSVLTYILLRALRMGKRRAIGLMPVARFFCCLKQDVQDFRDFQDEGGLGAAQQLWRQRQDLFRSAKTYMSIEQRGLPVKSWELYPNELL